MYFSHVEAGGKSNFAYPEERREKKYVKSEKQQPVRLSKRGVFCVSCQIASQPLRYVKHVNRAITAYMGEQSLLRLFAKLGFHKILFV